MSISIHIFRRDLRLDDNTSLLTQAKKGDTILPVFIFDERQVHNNEFRSDNAVQFMLESLKDLQSQLEKKDGKLYLFYGKSDKIISKLLEKINVESVHVNRDYTPFAKKKDEQIRNICDSKNIEFHQYEDALLAPIEGVKKQDGGWYTVYTPFYRTAREIEVPKPQELSHAQFFTDDISFSEDESVFDKVLSQHNESLAVNGGRENGLKIIDSLSALNDYKTIRDFPAKKGTSLLSAHHKFGTVSIRESYWRATELFGKFNHFVSELYWRDFATYIAYHFPHVFGKEFQQKYQSLDWSTNKESLNKWCEGKTGFPIVDAGMRQLNKTGYMHNRVRMIVASFLTKDLHLDWRLGEKYFAQKLVDYDPCVNNTSWQWAASTGCDAQPYFRIFNPWLQQQKFDEDCTYIKKWVPELVDLSPKQIHNLDTQRPLGELDYPQPIVNHKKEKDVTIAMFKNI